MNNASAYWKNLVLNMMFVFQTLFLASTTWDFFLTVSASSARSLVFSALDPLYTSIILVAWLVGIFTLAVFLIVFSTQIETKMPRTIPFNYEYGGFILLYIVLTGIALSNPAVSTFVAMNYVVNASWCIALIYYRNLIKHGMENY